MCTVLHKTLQIIMAHVQTIAEYGHVSHFEREQRLRALLHHFVQALIAPHQIHSRTQKKARAASPPCFQGPYPVTNRVDVLCYVRFAVVSRRSLSAVTAWSNVSTACPASNDMRCTLNCARPPQAAPSQRCTQHPQHLHSTSFSMSLAPSLLSLPLCVSLSYFGCFIPAPLVGRGYTLPWSRSR